METSKTNSQYEANWQKEEIKRMSKENARLAKQALEYISKPTVSGPVIPTLDLDPLRFHESTYTAYGNSYDAPTLVQFAKDKNYPVFDMPIVGIDMSELPFAVNSFAQFVWQLSRVQNTDLNYPILIDDHGTICDGWHRVAKAVMEGRSTIKAIRLQEMPEPSCKADTK